MLHGVYPRVITVPVLSLYCFLCRFVEAARICYTQKSIKLRIIHDFHCLSSLHHLAFYPKCMTLLYPFIRNVSIWQQKAQSYLLFLDLVSLFDHKQYQQHQNDSHRKGNPCALRKACHNICDKGHCCSRNCIWKLCRYMNHMITLSTC